ncbi:MAG: conjugal transfer protein TraI [Alphaproteobacteria bacterium]|nr:conjugal transfer protein TraI [Alphaproteobacteria bacterium]
MASVRKRKDSWQVQVRKHGHSSITKSFRVKAHGLAWARKVESEMERDDFDDLEPVYIVCEEDGEVLGSWRLLPTTGPYMLKDVFPELLHGIPAPVGEDVWEISRFAVSNRVAGNDSLGTVRRVTNHLLEGLVDFAAKNNVSRIVSVSDVRFERILKRAGLITNRFGPPIQVGNLKAVSGYVDLSELTLPRIELREPKKSKSPHILYKLIYKLLTFFRIKVS